MTESEKFTEEELRKYAKYFDKNVAFRLLKKLRKATRKKTPIVAGPTGVIVQMLGDLLSALDNPDTPPQLKALIVSAIGYIVLPIDAIPDFTPFIGYADDIGAVGAVVLMVKAYSTFDMEKLDAVIDAER